MWTSDIHTGATSLPTSLNAASCWPIKYVPLNVCRGLMWKSILATPLSFRLLLIKPEGKNFGFCALAFPSFVGNRDSDGPGVKFAGATVQVAVLRPAICALRGLIVSPAVFTALQASTRLTPGSVAVSPHPRAPPAHLTGVSILNPAPTL